MGIASHISYAYVPAPTFRGSRLILRANTANRRRRHRYNEIAHIVVRHGFAWLFSEWRFHEALGRVPTRWRSRTTNANPQSIRLRMALEELGTTFMKLGQVLSTRPDLLPKEYIAELSKLQDSAPAVSYEQVASVIANELQGSPSEFFLSIDEQPRASASIGQVHDARLLDGTPVVIKVRRPGVDLQVEEDLDILRHLGRLISQNSSLGKRLDIEEWIAEFAFSLRNELDYSREGRNADEIRENFAEDSSVHIPMVFWRYTTERVLTMEAIQGIKINDLEAIEESGLDRNELAKRCAHIALVQVLDHGFFHADPHPGNFFILPDGVIGLVDFGMVGRIEGKMRDSLVRLGLAVSRHDSERLIDELLGMGAAPRPVDRRKLRRDVDHLLQLYNGKPLGSVSTAQVFDDLMSTAFRNGLQLPSDLAMLFRVIVMDEGLGRLLCPGFHLLEFAKPYFRRTWRRTHSLSAVRRRFRKGAVEMADIGLDLPERLRHMLSQLERGELAITTSFDVPEGAMSRFQQIANTIALSILATGLIFGLSVMTLGYRLAGLGGAGLIVLEALLILAIGFGVWLILNALRKPR